MPIKNIRITPSWTFSDGAGNQVDSQLLSLLQALHKHGKLTTAAREAGISYRHSWNLLNKWSVFFGHPLVELQKGRGANLTPLGEKLVWAEQRVAARLGPQLDNLTSELRLALQQTLSDMQLVLRIHASHGFAVALLPKFCNGIQLNLQYTSAADALAAMSRGDCDIAGFHVPSEGITTSQMQECRQYFKPQVQRIIGFITRTQGIMVKSNNPKNIHSLTDLTQPDVRFINRQRSSGTRALLDALLQTGNIQVQSIQGYDQEEYTHSAVAAYIAAGMADAGFGVEAGARQFGLEFLPVVTEHYLLICHQRTLKQKAMQHFLDAIRTENFHRAVAELPGYTPIQCGDILHLDEALPWLFAKREPD